MTASGQPSQLLLNAQKELQKRRQLAGVNYRPPLPTDQSPTAWIAKLERPNPPDSPNPAVRAHPCGRPPGRPLDLPEHTQDKGRAQGAAPTVDIRIAPTLAATCLDHNNRHNNAALDGPYRLYKILQALDPNGRGWLSNQTVGELLTRKESPSYIYGRRQLKIILRRGEGLFWNRAKCGSGVRIRLVARAKLVTKLGINHLKGREVSFPLKMLLGSGRGRQAQVNAALYTAVHAGQIRGKKGDSRPITRARVQHHLRLLQIPPAQLRKTDGHKRSPQYSHPGPPQRLPA